MKSGRVIARVAAAIGPEDNDTVIEIGPGHGELTEELRTTNTMAKIIAVERDTALVDQLRAKFGNDPHIEIISGDILKTLENIVRGLRGTPYKLVGNIPYYITGHLLRTIGELEHKPLLSVFMVQKEVAERAASAPPRMNRLAAAVQFWGDVSILMSVSRKDFQPPPDVDSAVIAITAKPGLPGDRAAYDGLIHAVFQQPRKTVLNNLVAAFGKDPKKKASIASVLESAGVRTTDRPQNISIMTLVELSRVLSLETAQKDFSEKT